MFEFYFLVFHKVIIAVVSLYIFVDVVNSQTIEFVDEYERVRPYACNHVSTELKSPLCCSRAVDKNFHLRCLPGTIIAGTQKSGTTLLSAFLASHPQINFARTKEIHFFDKDDKYKLSLSEYLKYFPPWNHTTHRHPPLSIEATPFYIASKDGCKRIVETLPNVKLIVILREPVERAYSEYQMKKRRVGEQSEFIRLVQKHVFKVYHCLGKYFHNLSKLKVCVPAAVTDHPKWIKLVKVLTRFSKSMNNDVFSVLKHCFSSSPEDLYTMGSSLGTRKPKIVPSSQSFSSSQLYHPFTDTRNQAQSTEKSSPNMFFSESNEQEFFQLSKAVSVPSHRIQVLIRNQKKYISLNGDNRTEIALRQHSEPLDFVSFTDVRHGLLELYSSSSSRLENETMLSAPWTHSYELRPPLTPTHGQGCSSVRPSTGLSPDHNEVLGCGEANALNQSSWRTKIWEQRHVDRSHRVTSDDDSQHPYSRIWPQNNNIKGFEPAFGLGGDLSDVEHKDVHNSNQQQALFFQPRSCLKAEFESVGDLRQAMYSEMIQLMNCIGAAINGSTEELLETVYDRPCVKVKHGISSQYLYRSLYFVQLANCARWVSRDRMLVITSERLRSSPRAILTQVLSFLGLAVHNESMEAYLKDAQGLVDKHFPSFETRTGWRLSSFYEEMPSELKHRLHSFFVPYNRRLFDWLGEPLTEWI